MIRSTVLEIFKETWPTILISMVILVSLRLVYLLKNQKPIILYQELMTLLFMIYVLCLFYVVTFQDVSFNSSNLVVFHEMFRYEIGSQLFIKNVLGNMLLFIPYGFFTAYYLKLKKPYLILALSLLVSLTIEITQLLIGRVFDVDDIILNVTGGFLGFYLYYILMGIKGHLPDILKNRMIYNIIMVCLLMLALAYLVGFIELGV